MTEGGRGEKYTHIHIYTYTEETQSLGKKDKETYHLLVHSPNDPKDQSEARNPNCIPDLPHIQKGFQLLGLSFTTRTRIRTIET